jgi:Short C-terminal domain
MVRAMGLFSRKKRPDLDEIPPEAAAIVEQLTEMFPEATVTVNEPVEVDLDGGDGGDRISQLERLAKLREQGALTDSEFQAEKARILGEG